MTTLGVITEKLLQFQGWLKNTLSHCIRACCSEVSRIPSKSGILWHISLWAGVYKESQVRLDSPCVWEINSNAMDTNKSNIFAKTHLDLFGVNTNDCMGCCSLFGTYFPRAFCLAVRNETICCVELMTFIYATQNCAWLKFVQLSNDLWMIIWADITSLHVVSLIAPKCKCFPNNVTKFKWMGTSELRW